jgi:hypothetical protein
MSGNSYYAIQSLFEILVCEIGVVVSEHNIFFMAELNYKIKD